MLTCGEKAVPLTPRAFDVLLLLVQNAGSLVEKDVLLQNVWNDACVEEGNLAKHVSLLRKALTSTSNGTIYIETVPKRGYRFVAAVSEVQNGQAVATVLESRSEPRTDKAPDSLLRRRSGEKRLLVAGALLIIAVAGMLNWLLWPSPAPRALGTTQLTHSGRAWWAQKLLTDGVRLYFAERIGGREALAWVPIEGGDPVLISTPFSNTVLFDISPDHSTLLLGDLKGEEDAALWTMPVTGGSPQSLGTLTTRDAAWMPDNQGILLVRGRDIYMAHADGSGMRKTATIDGRPGHFRWSIDGRVLRFTVENTETSTISIWEASADGTNAHPWSSLQIRPKFGFLVGECCGVWTPNGKYFIYRSSDGNTTGLWARRESAGLRDRFHSKPFLLHTFPGALAFFAPLVAPDGKRIFFVAEEESRELVRYDANSKRFVPYLSGIAARRVDFSPDGEWVAYYTQDYRLWRSRVDGSDRMQLTFPPLSAATPRWSADGSNVAFRGDLPDGSSRIYLISRDGGSPEPITPAQFSHASDPCWMPDGNSLIFGEFEKEGFNDDEHILRQLDMKTREVEDLAGSNGLAPQAVSPHGREVAAFMLDGTRLLLFNPSSHRRTELAQGKSLYGVYWSRDGHYIYFQDLGGGVEQPIYRVRISDHKIESVAGLSKFSRTDAMAFSLAGLTPDSSPLASLMLNRGNVYALDVNFP